MIYLAAVMCGCGVVVTAHRGLRRGNVVTPHLIVFAMPFVLLFVPILFSKDPIFVESGYTLCLLAGSAGTVAAASLVRMPDLWVPARPSAVRRLHGGVLNLSTAAFLFVMGVIGYQAIQSAGGVVALLSGSRIADYQGGGILKGASTWNLLFTLLCPFFYLKIGHCCRTRRLRTAALLTACLSAYYVLTANTRLPMIAPFLVLGILAVGRLKIGFSKARLAVILAAGIVGLYAFSVVGNAIRGGWLFDIDTSDARGFVDLANEQLARDSGYPWALYDLYRKSVDAGNPREHGAAWYYYGPMALVPRVMWPDKPVTSTANRFTEWVYGVRVGSGTAISTFTIFGEGYMQFGLLGVFLAPLLFLVMYVLEIRLIGTMLDGQYWAIMQLVHMATFWRSEVPTVHFVLFLVTVGIMRLPLVSEGVDRGNAETGNGGRGTTREANGVVGPWKRCVDQSR